MSDIDDGGAAFPQPESSTRINPEGMTLRQWFAGKALQGLLAGSRWSSNTENRIADQAFQMADAMLKADKS